MKATDVFTPTARPTVTYYDRANLRLERNLIEGLSTKGTICSISGPSKCGKTVLCETVLGDDMISLSGAAITSISDFWAKLRYELSIAKSTTRTTGRTYGGEITGTGEASAGVPLLGQAKASVGGKINASGQQATSNAFDDNSSRGLFQVLRDRDIALVIDDFHYAKPEVQTLLAQEFKDAAWYGTYIVIVTVTQRSDQAIRANGDLRGRIRAIDIPYWSDEELIEIPRRGFAELNVALDDLSLRFLVKESVSSPQLMQSLCLRICTEHSYDNRQPSLVNRAFSASELQNILRQVSATANCATAYGKLKNGPSRGPQRKVYQLPNRSTGDIYSIILDAIASGEPALTFSNADLKSRISTLIASSSVEPRGGEITKALAHMGAIVKEMPIEDHVLDYDAERGTLHIVDPYFLYYLRWARN